MLKAAVKMIEEGWKFVHTVADDNGVSAETDRPGAVFGSPWRILKQPLKRSTESQLRQ